MSRGPYLLAASRWGGRMGDIQATDYMMGVLHDPFHRIHMGITAESVADRAASSTDRASPEGSHPCHRQRAHEIALRQEGMASADAAPREAAAAVAGAA